MRYWKKFVESLNSASMTNLDMIKACEDAGLERLAKVKKYSSRDVFALNDKYVIKICRSTAGNHQNWNEINLTEYMGNNRSQNKYFAKLLVELSDTTWGYFVIMERLEVNNRKAGRALWCTKNNALRDMVSQMDKAMTLLNRQDLNYTNVGFDSQGNMKVLDFGASGQVLKMYSAARQARANHPARRCILTAEQDVCVSEM